MKLLVLRKIRQHLSVCISRTGTAPIFRHDKRWIVANCMPSHLVTCTSKGRVSYTSLSSYSATSNPNTTTCISENIGTHLSTMRVHPLRSNLFAIGGKDRENDLQIFDANVLSTSVTESQEENAANMTKFEKKKAKNKGLLFQAKNVKYTTLERYNWMVSF